MIVIDIEASGTEYQLHSIVSLGAIDMSNPKRQFYVECRVWDGAHIMEEALAVNGFTEAQITDATKMSEAELVREFMEWTQMCSDRTLVGQNVSFDRDMLKAAVIRAGENWTLPYRTLDTHTMCYMHMVKAGIMPPFDAE
ncbi:MAG: exonuclease domain-containing protein, partial [Anaerolineales bacterium]